MTELLYSVFGYLTTREKVLILSSKHDAAAVAELLGELVELNGLPKVRHSYGKNGQGRIKTNLKTDSLTNLPEVKESIGGETQQKGTADNPVDIIRRVLYGFDLEGQNKIIFELLGQLENERIKRTDELYKRGEDINAQIDYVKNARRTLIDLITSNLAANGTPRNNG